jgi:hypothetical protein
MTHGAAGLFDPTVAPGRFGLSAVLFGPATCRPASRLDRVEMGDVT